MNINTISNSAPPAIGEELNDVKYTDKDLSLPLNQIHSKSNSPLLKEIKEIKISGNDKGLFEPQEVPSTPPKKVSLLRF